MENGQAVADKSAAATGSATPWIQLQTLLSEQKFDEVHVRSILSNSIFVESYYSKARAAYFGV